ncbi:hypothetical protein WDW86_02450, partial [Bdellovibrionota bacterium FG-2]
ESDPTYSDFQRVEVTKEDDSKPWKPPVEVRVTLADGAVKEGVKAETPFYTLHSSDGKLDLIVSAAASGHIDALHIKGTEPGSLFDYPSLDSLMEDVSKKIKPEMFVGPGPSAFSVEMGRPMGKEGIASLDELKARGDIDDEDLKSVLTVRSEVAQLNLAGALEAKKTFVDNFKKMNPESKIQFQVLRDTVILPVAELPKQETTQLFMVFGPDENRPGQKTAWTMAPGRWMPKHPNASQHMEKQADGSMKLNEVSFKESSDAWFDTVMLTGK